MISALFRFVVLAVAGWLIARLLRGATRTATQPPRSRATQPSSGGAMVRDRVCNTFLPRANALAEQAGGQTHYFCSETCRLRFLGGQGAR